MLGPSSLERLSVHVTWQQKAPLPKGCDRHGPRGPRAVHMMGLASRERRLKHSTGQQRACLASRWSRHGGKRQGPGLHQQWGSQQPLWVPGR